jgi:succinate dehydrogenase / fumarate reductase, cytochrome b subunit
MTDQRPIFLDLWRIRLPIAGLVSILHRISGILMVLAIPVFTLLFALALEGPDGFASAAAIVAHPVGKLGLLILGWAMLHHFFSGLRYLVIDLGIGVDKPVARSTAWGVLSTGLALTVIGGGWLL